MEDDLEPEPVKIRDVVENLSLSAIVFIPLALLVITLTVISGDIGITIILVMMLPSSWREYITPAIETVKEKNRLRAQREAFLRSKK